MTAILIRGGRLLDQTGERDGDVRDRRRPDRRGRRRPAPASDERRGHRRHRLRREPRLRRPPRAPARAGQGGGRDDRDRQPCRGARRLHRDRRDAEHRSDAGLRRGRRLRPPAGRARRAVRGAPGGGDHRRPARRPARAVRRTGRGRRADLHRRRQRGAGPAADAPGVRVLARSRHHARPALRGGPAHRGRGDARGLVLQPVRAAGLAVDRRGADGPPRHRTRPAHRRPGALPPPVDRGQRRARPRRQGRRAAGHGRGGAAPLQPDRRAAWPATTRRSRSTRRCGPPTTSPRSAPGSPTARSTRSPPTTHRTPARRRSSRSTRRRPGCSGWRRRSACRSPISTCRSPT